MELVKIESAVDYFDIGSPEDIVVSSSTLKYINPDEGGSPEVFMASLSNQLEKKDSVSLSRGTLLHDWQEKRSNFIVADFEKPTDNIAKVVEYAFSNNTEYIKSNNPTYLDILPSILEACKILGYGQSWKPETLVKKLEDGRAKEYYNHLILADGKVAITGKDAEILNNCIASINNHKSANKYLHTDDFGNESVLKEVVVCFNITTLKGNIVKGKSKLDVVRIDHANKIIKIVDLKTTSDSVYTYGKYAYYRYRNDRQNAFYRLAIKTALSHLISDGYTIENYNVVVETGRKFECQVWKSPDSVIDAATIEIYDLCDRIAYHQATGNWKTPIEFIESEFAIIEPSRNMQIDEILKNTL